MIPIARSWSTSCLLGALWLVVCLGSRLLADAIPAGAGLVFWPRTNQARSPHLLTNLSLRFRYTNHLEAPVRVLGVDASCHCTTPKIPALPWTIGPHAAGELEVVVEIPGKWGLLEKTLRLWTADATNTLTVRVDIPEPDERQKNRLAAFADRQAVFKGDCANCHSTPAVGLTGAELYRAACAICHEAEHRASMVPDLAAKPHGGAAYWSQWIRIGKPGSFMPGFDRSYTGPLTEPQILSLIRYLEGRFPPTPGAKVALPLE
jgi:mono/diheme cytochrome c family protein